MQSIKSTVGLCVVFISIVLVMFFFSKLRVPELSADEMRTQGVFILPTPRDIGPFELLDHTGAVFNRQSLEGHWSFIFFGFTNCPDVCPTSMQELKLIKKNLGQQGKDFQVLFVTLDPERDSQSLLKQYVPSFDASFIGLTGTKDQIEKIAQQYKIFHQKVGDGKSYTIDHSSAIYLLDKDGMIRVRYPYGSSVKGMIEDIKHLISV